MDKPPKYYQELLEKWMQGQLTPGQAEKLMDYLQQDSSSRVLLQQMQQQFHESLANPGRVSPELSERVKHQILQTIQPAAALVLQAPRRRYWYRIAAAAAIIIGLTTILYFAFLRKDNEKGLVKNTATPPAMHDVKAGSNKAVLTLADGTKIELDDNSKGSVLKSGQVDVTNTGGQLVYKKKSATPGEVEYNTLTSARGQSYSLVLADGSTLWLNASSSVRFPTAFTGNERRVEITGEVFFDVAKDASRPFHVKINDLDVEVLGTQFNINSYADEATINTTLIEGSVKISAADKNRKLVPGQQAQLSSQGDLKVVNNVNVDEIIAWKNGYFHFENADLRSILRQFSRWYDIQVVYEGELRNRHFFAIVSRASSLANVLKMLDANDVKFRIEGKKLIVQSY